MSHIYFEDFELGRSTESPRKTVTDADLTLFSGITGDFNPQHTDDVFAASTPIGKRIAHGALTFSIAVGLSTRISPPNPAFLTFVGVDDLRFTRPVVIGDTIHVRKEVVALEPQGARRGLVRFETKVFNQNDQLVAHYRDSLLFERRPA